ncbi:putative Flp pilus-assembly TadE/G-like protein [Brevibacterium sanguinis]|uniref:Flp pilus-assembly TadE/G-like protein n=2 Tax=Brevibacterium TaxID=1696 RepID=A0ABX9GU70_9MICO|nr:MULTISPECIES: pilus assembly protein TadG-related protein [Brevibacterium]RBP68135.1 putative Flp pilus-assembly TadE/G-like protein [Brevibacterium sanguinis]RBP74448.1 putative Flp pilus-assembly TadE/G-like protein [Brevibacterium celere]
MSPPTPAAADMPRRSTDPRSDDGSITPLAIGFVVIALLLTFLIAALTDLHMARRQLQSLADSAALAASDSFEPAPGSDPGLLFTPEAAERAAGVYLAQVPTPTDLRDVRLSADADGDHSVAIHLRADYSPPLLSPFVPRLIELRATAFARGSLRIS